MCDGNLYSGVAVLIDDEIDNPRANVAELKKSIERKKIPYLSYDSIPDIEAIHFRDISFLILDWKLSSLAEEEIIEGVTLQGLSASGISENIEFIEKIKDLCFIPIFIFTNESTDVIKNKLKENGLYHENRPNFIFVKSKSELNANLFDEIESWINANPPVYVLKKWEKCYKKAKSALFSYFFNLSPSWPGILWKTYTQDSVNCNNEIRNTISQNILTRMGMLNLQESKVKKDGETSVSDCSEITKVLQGSYLIKNENLSKNDIAPGDIFFLNEGHSMQGVPAGTRYLLNIRPECDTVVGRLPGSHAADDTRLYCLPGIVHVFDASTDLEGGSGEKGLIIEKISCALVPFIDPNNGWIEFDFKNLYIFKWSQLRNKRTGRLLPPYITRIKQRYAQFLQREGLPRIPKELIPIP